MKKLVAPLFIIVGLIGVSGTGAIAQTAAETTDQFYAKLASLNIRGLPDADQLKEISPFLSGNIIAVIRRDQKKQDAFSKKRPDEKPPWAEGDLFSSLFEGRTSYQLGRTRRVGSSTYVDVKLEYADGTNTSRWTDTAILKKTAGEWRITNILYKGRWQFKSGSSLLNALK